MKRENKIDYSDFNVNKFKKKGKWNIVGALDCVLQLSENSELCDEFFVTAKSPLKFLRITLGLTDIQIIVIGIMVESGKSESWRTFGNYLGISRLTMMTYSEEVEELLKKGWIKRSASHESGGHYQGFKLTFGVVTALRKNKVFQPEKIDGLTLQEFMDRMENYMNKNLNSHNFIDNEELMERIDTMIEMNQGLELCRVLKKIEDVHERFIMVLILVDYAQYADSQEEGINYHYIDSLLDDDYNIYNIKDSLKDGSLNIFTWSLVEFECNDGIANNECYLLTKEVKNNLLCEYKPRRTQVKDHKALQDNLVKKHEDLIAKEMFYNPSEETQISKLASLLEEEKFKGVQKRLEEEGMRKGFACIFYGAPGTGKTETVIQLARQTGRDIMQIEIAGLKDKWVGESEKNIKSVFQRYKSVCENQKVKPILFFNEADAIFGERFEKTTHSVDKMENAMQNIILQEIENLDGILIATTNLTGALDKAFERRFLYKVEFNKPKGEVKEKIWKSMFKGKLSDQQVRTLANKYDFSGGEIENIARKRTVDFILEGEEMNFDQLCSYCDQERLNKTNQRKVGFGN